MPVVTIELWEGRTLEQKRRLVRAITDAMVEHASARPDALHVILHEVGRENWGRAGVLGVDRSDAAVGPADVAAPRARALGHLLLETTDLERSERFYLDLLGLTVRKRERFRDGRPLTVTNEGLGLTSGRTTEGGPVDHIAFRADRVRALAEKAQHAGVPVLRGPEPSSYGISVYLADPDGNRIELFGEDDEREAE